MTKVFGNRRAWNRSRHEENYPSAIEHGKEAQRCTHKCRFGVHVTTLTLVLSSEEALAITGRVTMNGNSNTRSRWAFVLESGR